MPDAVLTTSDGGTSGVVPATSEESGATTTFTTTSTSTTLGTSASTGSTSDAETTTTTDGGVVPYASCNDQDCPRGWDECIDPQNVSWCSHYCDTPDDCEAPLTGDAEVVCAGPSGNSCALDCSNGQTCPDGMSCTELFSVVRCVWE